MELDIRNLVKDYGDTPALYGIDLKVRSGELLALLGPSGSGKTTLLKLIAGLDHPTGGRIFFGGEDASEKTVQERQIGFVFQSYALFRHLTVEDNIAYGLRVRPRSRRPSSAAIRTKVAELLELIQLAGYGGRYPNQLSGGQRQRVALARALAVEPRVLLLDEPFGALDAKVRKELRRWLRQLHDEIHVTSVFVTHDQEEALGVADRVVVMDKGRIEQIGTPDDVYTRPASAFVHEFIGESIVLPVTVEGGSVHLHGSGTGLDAQGAMQGPARLFIRPYDVNIVDANSAPLKGTVRRIHGLGQQRRIEVALQAEESFIEIDAPATRMAPGDIVGLAPQHYRLFSNSAEER
jgi:sulfate transport system ATP-binding protein